MAILPRWLWSVWQKWDLPIWTWEIILSENILWGATKNPHNIVALVQAVDSPWFGWCFDTGFVHCNGIPVSALQNVAVAPLSLHIQDNCVAGSGDQHYMPGDGTIDWKEFLDILCGIGYEGDLVLEAHHQSIDGPDEERKQILTELLERTRKMQEYVGKKT